MSSAELGFKIDSAPAQRAAVDLDQLTVAATKTETSVSKLGESSKRAFSSAGEGASQFARNIQQAAERAETMASRINRALNVRDTFSGMDRGRDIEEYGRKLDGLRAKINPTFAAIQQYKSALVDIRQAHRLGAISSGEMTAAIQRERQSALASIAAIKARNAALRDTPAVSPGGASAYNTANLAAQFQDIAVTSAMGMSPLQIALQQGTQISAVLGPMGAAGAVKGLGAAFASIINPVSLVTLGLVAAGSAAIQYFGSTVSQAKTADDAIKAHAETIETIKAAYGVAAEGLGDYVQKSQAEAAAAARTNLKVQQDFLKTAITDFNNTIGTLQARTGGASDVGSRFAPFADAIREFRKSVAEGKPDFVELRTQIEAIVSTNPSGLRALGDEILNGSTAAADAERRVRSAKDVMSGLGDVASRQVNGVATLKNALNELASIALPALSDSERALKAYREAVDAAQGSEDRRAAARAYDAARQRIENENPTVLNSDGRTSSIPVPGSKPLQMADETRSRLFSLGNTDFSTATQGANTLATAVGGISSASQTATQSITNVTQQLADAKINRFMALEQQANQLKDMRSQLADVQKILAEASKTPLSQIFGDGVTGAGVAEAVERAVSSVNSLFAQLQKGSISAETAHLNLEMVRQSLYQLGGDAKSVDAFINSLVAANNMARQLDGSVKSLSASIMGIPNRTISIGIQQYTVGASGGGTTAVNVHGGQADYTYQSYDVGGGKTVGVTGMNGDYGGYSTGNSSGGGLVRYSKSQILGMNESTYNNLIAGNSTGGVPNESYSQYHAAYGGARAAGGPTEAGMTYLVGEKGPELLTMQGAGNVTNANSTASILSGGRDTLSLIEDHLYNLVQEMRIHTNYFETFESDFSDMIACLKKIESVGGSSSYSGGGSSSRSSSYSGSSGSSDSGQSHLDPYSPYYFNAARNNAGRGGGRYDPVADALMNGNTGALRGLSGGPTEALSRALGAISGSGGPSLLDRLKKQAGFATGGQIMPGEDQKVEFFKRRKERVIIVDNDNVSDQRGGSQQVGAVRDVNLTVNFPGGNPSDPRSRQAMTDEFVRAVKQAVRM